MLSPRTLSWIVFGAAASFLATPASAGDWKCGNKGGCVANYCCDENGKMRSVDLPEGSVVSTDGERTRMSTSMWRKGTCRAGRPTLGTAGACW